MSRGKSVLTLEQYKELLRLSAEAKAAGKDLECWKIAYDWGINAGTLKCIRRRGIKRYDAMIRKEQQQKAREEAERQRLREVSAELLKTLKWLDAWLGSKPMPECVSRIHDAIARAGEPKPCA